MVWQKRVRALLGVLVLLLVAGVTWYVTRERTQAAPAPVSPRTDENADIEISGNEDVRTDEAGNVIFSLKYDHGFVYTAQNRVRLINVTGLLPRGGKPINFKANQVELKLKSGNTTDFASFDEMKLRGNVLIKSGPGAEVLHFESSEVDYNELTGIMTTDKPAKMK
jgi:LPS export ABC transporter protein LptC